MKLFAQYAQSGFEIYCDNVTSVCETQIFLEGSCTVAVCVVFCCVTCTLGPFSRSSWVTRFPPWRTFSMCSSPAGQSKSFHILSETISPCPIGLIPSVSIIVRHAIQSASSLRFTWPNHLNLPCLIIKLTGFKPDSSLSSAHFFHKPTCPPNRAHYAG